MAIKAKRAQQSLASREAIGRFRPIHRSLLSISHKTIPYILTARFPGMFTSGSTGRPKGVVVTHKPLLRRISWMRRTFPISEGDVVPCKTQYVFGVSEWELFHTLTSGATLDLRCDNVVLRQPAALSERLGDAAALTGHASTVRLHFLENYRDTEQPFSLPTNHPVWQRRAPSSSWCPPTSTCCCKRCV